MNDPTEAHYITEDEADRRELEEWLNLPAAELDRRSVELTAWLCQTFPKLALMERHCKLDPDKYPEHQVLLDFYHMYDEWRVTVQQIISETGVELWSQ